VFYDIKIGADMNIPKYIKLFRAKRDFIKTVCKLSDSCSVHLLRDTSRIFFCSKCN